MLKAKGLEPISGHFPFERYRDDVEGIARDAKTLGLQYVGCAWIPHEGDFDEKECRDAIAAERATSRAGKQGFRGSRAALTKPAAQSIGGVAAKRGATLLASLTPAVDVGDRKSVV